MKLGAAQLAATINAIQQAIDWCEVCSNSGQEIAMCASNLESVMYVGNAQRPNYGNAYNMKWKTQQPSQLWNAPQP